MKIQMKRNIFMPVERYTVIVPCLPNEDGDFEAYSLTMKVTISKDKITDISEIKGDGSSDNDAYIKRQYRELPNFLVW